MLGNSDVLSFSRIAPWEGRELDDVGASPNADAQGCIAVDRSNRSTFVLGTYEGVVGISFMVLLPLSGILLSALYFHFRRKYTLISMRGALLNVVILIGSLLQLPLAWDTAHGYEGTNCLWVDGNIVVLGVFQLLPITLKVIAFMFRIRLNRQMATFDLEDAIKRKESVQLSGERLNELMGERSAHKKKKSMINIRERTHASQDPIIIDNNKHDLIDGQSNASLFTGTPSGPVLPELSSATGLDAQRNTIGSTAFSLPNFSTKWFANIYNINILMILIILITFVVAPIRRAALGATKCITPCRVQVDSLYGLSITSFVILIITVYALRKVWKEPDPFNFKVEIVAYFVVSILFGFIPQIVLFIRAYQRLIENYDNNVDADELNFTRTIAFEIEFSKEIGRVTYESWLTASLFFIIIAFCYPLCLVRRQVRGVKRAGRSFTDEGLSLAEVLESETGRSYFKARLINELSIENFLCWRDCKLYSEGFAKRNLHENELFRQSLVETYLSDRAALEVNIGHKLKLFITQRLLTPPNKDDLIELQQEMLRNMADTFSRFQLTEQYKALHSWDTLSNSLRI